MTKPLYFDVPEDAMFRPCRACRTPIAFVTTQAGRKMPVDRDGRSHYQTCTEPSRFSRKGKQ